MKRILKLLLLETFLFSCGAAENLPGSEIAGFEESATDEMGNAGIRLQNRNMMLGEGTETDRSRMFVQSGETEEGMRCLRFAVAVKGNISSLSFRRGHVEGKEDVGEFVVSTVYRGILASGKEYYYNPEDPESIDGLTVNPSYAGHYYWACYTIRFLDGGFATSNIPMTFTVNGTDRIDRSASLAELLYGEHDHVYEHFDYDSARHWKTCALCGTIDGESYHAHDYTECVPSFSRVYREGEAFQKDDGLTLFESCECRRKSGREIDFEYVDIPVGELGLGDSLLIRSELGERDIVIPVDGMSEMTKTDSNLKYGGGNAGIVGRDTDFRFKESYRIEDGRFVMNGTEGDYSYGNVFINIDVNAHLNPYLQMTVHSASDAKVKLFLSASNNYVKRDGVWGSYEQELKKSMELVINGESVNYDDVTLKAIPSSALENLEKNSETYKRYVYFTFFEYELTTTALKKGDNTIRLNFKNGYGGTGAASCDADQPCVGCINYLRFETVPEDGIHVHTFDRMNSDDRYHWMECRCGEVDSSTKERHDLQLSFIPGEYRAGSVFGGKEDLILSGTCKCGYETAENTNFVLKDVPETLKIGDRLTIEVNEEEYTYEIPVYELNIKQVPVKQDYTEGEHFDATGLILNKKFSSSQSDYENFDPENVTFDNRELTRSDTFVTVRYDGLSIDIPISVRSGAIKIELEDNLMMTYTKGTRPDKTSVMPGSKLKITRTEDGKYQVEGVNETFDTYEAAYEAAYNKGTAATKAQVAQASEGDFLAFLDGTGATFTANLTEVKAEEMELYIRGASNYAFDMRNWTPYQIGAISLKDFMTVKVNGAEIELSEELILPGCGDGSKGDHSYWTNWVTLDLGKIRLDPTSETNTIEFTVAIDKGLNEEGIYKYCYNNNTSYAFGQYDYILLEDIA